MANTIRYIDDSAGDHVFPVTHERGVMDDTGQTIEPKLQHAQDLEDALVIATTYDSTALGALTKNDYMIDGSTGKWGTTTTSKHLRIDVNPGDNVYVTSNSSNGAGVAFFNATTAASSGGTPKYAAGYSNRLALPAGTTERFLAPADAMQLYLYAGTSSNSYAYIPASVSIRRVTAVKESSPLMVIDMPGKGNTLSASVANTNFIVGHTYRAHIIAWDTSSVTSTSNYDKFTIRAKDGSGTVSYLVQKVMSDVLEGYYDFTIPEGTKSVSIGGRCNAATYGVVEIEDITLSGALETAMEKRPEATQNVISNNILDPSTLKGTTENKYVNRNDGTVSVTNTAWGYTDYIPLPQEGLICNHCFTTVGTGGCRFAYYDADKQFLSANAVVDTEAAAATWEEGRAYVRFNLGNPATLPEGQGYAVYKGNTLKTYDEYATAWQYGTGDIEDKSVTVEKLADGYSEAVVASSAMQNEFADQLKSVSGFRTTYPAVSKITGLLINEGNSFASNQSSNYVVWYVPVSKGDIVHYTATGPSSSTLKMGFTTVVPAAGNRAWCPAPAFGDNPDYATIAPIDGYFAVYHLASSFTDQVFMVEKATSATKTLRTVNDEADMLLRSLGFTEYERLYPKWRNGYFVYYYNADPATSSTLSYCDYIPTNGAKYLYFTQLKAVSGDTAAGIAFYDESGNFLRGHRAITNAETSGYKPIVIEIPENVASFRCTCLISQQPDWFGYLFSDDNMAETIRKALGETHLKICLLGNSYMADAWRYVPTMLLDYGITMESWFYYRGSGSLWDLDEQWTHDSEWDINNWGQNQQMRFTYYVNSASNPQWRQMTRVSAQTVVSRQKWDIIVMLEAGAPAASVSSYSPYLQNVIDKILIECPYPFTLAWFMPYAGSRLSSNGVFPQTSIAAQHEIYKTYPFNMLIPTATAVWNGDTNDTLNALGDSEYRYMTAPDNIHLQEGLPCYLAACTVVQAILNKYKPGMSVLGNTFRATESALQYVGLNGTADGDPIGVTESNCYLAQKAAIIANNNPWEITQI